MDCAISSQVLVQIGKYVPKTVQPSRPSLSGTTTSSVGLCELSIRWPYGHTEAKHLPSSGMSAWNRTLIGGVKRKRERETVGGKKREIVAVFALHVEAVQNPGFAEENKHTLQFDMNSYEFI